MPFCAMSWSLTIKKKAPFVNNNLCWPRPQFFSTVLCVCSWISRYCSFFTTPTTNLWSGTKKRCPNPSMACCINCPKKSFGQRKHNQMQELKGELQWPVLWATQDFLFGEIHYSLESPIFSALQYMWRWWLHGAILIRKMMKGIPFAPFLFASAKKFCA